MNAYIKLKGIDDPVFVENVVTIKTECNTTGDKKEIKDFKEFSFYSNYYFVFVGKNILHAWGHNIEYVLFV